MMDRVKGWRLLGAVGVAMALFAFAVLGIGVVGARAGAPRTFWSLYLWPHLAMLLTALSVVAAALTTACLARRRRPERLAAVIGGLGWLLAACLQVWSMGFRPAGVAAGVLSMLTWFRRLGLPLAVGCWLGANYWRSGTVTQFRAGPGGAILRGGLVAGLVVVPLGVLVDWSQHAAEMGYLAAHSLPVWAFSPGGHAVVALGAVADAAVVTALLVPWRPRPWRGAFAGSGIAAGLGGLVLLVAWLVTAGPLSPPSLLHHDLLRMQLRLELLDIGVAAIMGAIAGSFAGRWKTEGDG
jgi:hypothetical protein